MVYGRRHCFSINAERHLAKAGGSKCKERGITQPPQWSGSATEGAGAQRRAARNGAQRSAGNLGRLLARAGGAGPPSVCLPRLAQSAGKCFCFGLELLRVGVAGGKVPLEVGPEDGSVTAGCRREETSSLQCLFLTEDPPSIRLTPSCIEMYTPFRVYRYCRENQWIDWHKAMCSVLGGEVVDMNGEDTLRKYGRLLSINQLAALLDRSKEGLRITLRSSGKWVKQISETRLRLGRRVYRCTSEILQVLGMR